jgi:hypothetical protein
VNTIDGGMRCPKAVRFVRNAGRKNHWGNFPGEGIPRMVIDPGVRTVTMRINVNAIKSIKNGFANSKKSGDRRTRNDLGFWYGGINSKSSLGLPRNNTI